MPDNNKSIIDALIRSYNMEIETVINYIACSVNLDGVRAKEIKNVLQQEITDEMAHAQLLAKRIKTIGGMAPGSMALRMEQRSLQPTADPTDVVAVIKGVIEAEEAAITGYKKIIELTDGEDYATQDMAIGLLADEQEHRREFVGFLKEYEKKA